MLPAEERGTGERAREKTPASPETRFSGREAPLAWVSLVLTHTPLRHTPDPQAKPPFTPQPPVKLVSDTKLFSFPHSTCH